MLPHTSCDIPRAQKEKWQQLFDVHLKRLVSAHVVSANNPLPASEAQLGPASERYHPSDLERVFQHEKFLGPYRVDHLSHFGQHSCADLRHGKPAGNLQLETIYKGSYPLPR